MELKQYLAILLRWLWLLVTGASLGAGAGFYMSSRQIPVYQASTRLLVMRPPLEQSSDLTYYSDLQLVQTYIQLLTTQPVLDGASARLGYEVKKSQIVVKQNQDTQIIALTVEDESPQRAADIANVLLAVLTEQNESLQSGRYASTEESIRAQITQVESQIDRIQGDVDQITSRSLEEQLAQVQSQIQPLEQEVSTLQQEIAALEPAPSTRPAEAQALRAQIALKKARIDQIQPLLDLYQEIYSNLVVLGKPVESGTNSDARLARLQSTLDLYQNLYMNLLSSLETIRLARLQNTPNIVQIEPASAPKAPIRPRPLQNTALAGAMGLMLAAGIAFLVEYLDDSIKTPEDVQRALGLPVLGLVAEIQYKGKKGERVHVSEQPRSPVAEAFRSLRTNLEFAAVAGPVRTILVTSPGPQEGKTTVAVNLAAVIALSGKTVALVDADMRRPAVHRLLGIPNRNGLSSLFRSQAGAQAATRTYMDLPNLRVITSGSPPPNPAELLGSERMSQILTQLTMFADVVVIDTPPSLVADAQILAGKVDAVLFVTRPGRTRADTAAAALELFRRSGARVIGTVLNCIPRNRSHYYGAYRYYSPYSNKGYYSSTAEAGKGQPEEIKPVAAEMLPPASLLGRVSRLSSTLPVDDLPQPDPGRKSPAWDQ